MATTSMTLTDDLPTAPGISEDGNSQFGFAAVYIGLISAIGLVLNLLVVMVIIVLRGYKKTTDWYVLNLTIADALFLILLAVSVRQNTAGEWTMGLPACVAFQGGFYITRYAGILFLLVMSFDRYVAITKPTSSLLTTSRSRIGSSFLAITIWCLAVAASLPLMINSTIRDGVCDFSFEDVERIHPDCEALGIRTAKRCEVFRNLGTASDDLLIKDIEEAIYDSFLDGYEDVYYAYPDNSIGEMTPDEASSSEDQFYSVFTDDNGKDYEVPTIRNSTQPNADLPTIMKGGKYRYDCFNEVTEAKNKWIIWNFVIFFALPLCMMACCYGGILFHRRKTSTQPSDTETSTSQSDVNELSETTKKMDNEIRLTIFVVVLTVASIVCRLPLHSVMLSRVRGLDWSADTCHTIRYVRNVTVLVAYTNSALNPILYAIFGVSFAERLKKVMQRILGRTRPAALKGTAAESQVSLSKLSPTQQASTNCDSTNVEMVAEELTTRSISMDNN